MTKLYLLRNKSIQSILCLLCCFVYNNTLFAQNKALGFSAGAGKMFIIQSGDFRDFEKSGTAIHLSASYDNLFKVNKHLNISAYASFNQCELKSKNVNWPINGKISLYNAFALIGFTKEHFINVKFGPGFTIESNKSDVRLSHELKPYFSFLINPELKLYKSKKVSIGINTPVLITDLQNSINYLFFKATPTSGGEDINFFVAPYLKIAL